MPAAASRFRALSRDWWLGGGGRRDERGRGRELDEAEAVQNRPALRPGVDLQITEAPVCGERGAVRDERAEDAAPSPAGQGAAAPEAGELGAWVKLQSPSADRGVTGHGDNGRNRRRMAPQPAQQLPAQSGVIFAKHLVVDPHERVDAVLVGDGTQFDPRGWLDRERQLGDIGDHQRLGRLGREAGGQATAPQICRGAWEWKHYSYPLTTNLCPSPEVSSAPR